MTNISIVVTAYNEEQYVGACLESIERYAAEEVSEIIVVDNASTDRTADIARSFPGVRVVHEAQKGVSYAHATGLREAKGPIIAFLDADTRIPDGRWIQRIHTVFKNDERIISFSGPYRYYDFPAWLNLLVTLYALTVVQLTYVLTGYKVVGGNFIVKKDALESIGGFDTRIQFYGDDTDIARRLAVRGPVRYEHRFWVWASARRFKREGVLKLVVRYFLNTWSEIIFHKPYSKTSIDVR